MIVKTVKVKADNEWGCIVINESDMNNNHELYDDVPQVQEVAETEDVKPKKRVRRKTAG